MSCWPHPIKAIIFDNDGTFSDTLDIYIEAINRVIGTPMSQEFIDRVNGMDATTVAKKSIEEYKLNIEVDDFNTQRDSYLMDLLKRCKPFPGVVELAKKLKQKGYKIGLATSDNLERTKAKFENKQDILPIFDVIMTCDNVKNAKPDPEIFIECAKKLGISDPCNVLVFEDAINGIIAANRAGMASAFFANGKKNVEENFSKFKCNPSYIFQKYDEFDMSKFNWN